MDTTFMAKPYPGQAGNGLHVHISLLDKHGNNIFTGEDPEQNAALRHAIGGVLETLPASMAFLCPNVNSYRPVTPGVAGSSPVRCAIHFPSRVHHPELAVFRQKAGSQAATRGSRFTGHLAQPTRSGSSVG